MMPQIEPPPPSSSPAVCPVAAQGRRVSIALASYNGARFIADQLQSFADQLLLPDEVIVRDDGSTDDTLAIVERFAATAPFRMDAARNPERLGYSRNFEGALAACTGDIVFFSDQDDVWFAEKIAKVVDAFAANPELQVIVNDQVLADGDLRHEGLTKLGNLARLGIGAEGLIEGCCTAFRRAWGEALLPIPAAATVLIERRALSHDRWLNELTMLLGRRGVLATPLQYFRRYGSNTTDWFVSEPRRVGVRDLIAARVARAPIAAWRERVAVLDVYRGWIADHRPFLATLGGDVAAALSALDRERAAYADRCALASRRWPRRLLAAAAMWRRGGYRYFLGWKSAVRDVVRGTATIRDTEG